MPDLLTPQALATAGPLVLETLFKHYLARNPLKHNGQAREDLMYDEAFVLMKTFLEIATTYPVAALQRFGAVTTPAPPWVGLHRVLISHQSLDLAADFLIKALGGKDMAYKIAGGSKWWQVRAGPGVQGEWIIMKKDWKDYRAKERDFESQNKDALADVGLAGEDEGLKQNGQFRKEMDELRCMLYIHGGAYYWGSINTHRYTIWRYARKMHGRCFAVNYRKAPQYPFPCAIQDCLAAYLYLVKPPPGSKHKPVDPKNMVIGGDSAGGGLVLALLQILRDTDGLELPAGAVLISPWSDLTHSFPSLLKNTATDIVPPYGFIHKPSSLWPPPPPDVTDEIQSRLRTRVRDAIHKAKDGARDRKASVASKLGVKGDDHEPPNSTAEEHVKDILHSNLVVHQKEPIRRQSEGVTATSEPNETSNGPSAHDKRLQPMTHGGDDDAHPHPQGEPRINPSSVNPGLLFSQLRDRTAEPGSSTNTTLAQCDLPLCLELEDRELDINTQCQLYATNAQLCHPWVSPILGYMGGLPPLFICAGNNEVLRDEIIYVAHKAAHPQDHPIRDDVKALLPSLQGIEERYGPTNVHLQVYDGACHDLPLFSMTRPARGLFRAIASFIRYVTPSAPGSLAISRSNVASEASATSSKAVSRASSRPTPGMITMTPTNLTPNASDLHLDESADESALPATTATERQINDRTDPASMVQSPSSLKPERPFTFPLPITSPLPGSGPTGDDAGPRFEDGEGEDIATRDSAAAPGEAGYSGIYRGPDPFTGHMIRERVSSSGVCRPLEASSKLSAMTMPKNEIGVIKEGPALRYLNGQEVWDKKYSRALKTIQRHRQQNLKEAREKDVQKLRAMWDARAEDYRVKSQSHPESQRAETDTATDHETDASGSSRLHLRHTQESGPDTSEDLLDQSWSWTWALEEEAPPPSAVVSRRDYKEGRQLALMADRMDSDHSSPIHGLSLWVGLAAFFSNSSERNKAHDVLKTAHAVKQAEKERKAANKRSESDLNAGMREKTHGVRETFRRFEESIGLGKKKEDEGRSQSTSEMEDAKGHGR